MAADAAKADTKPRLRFGIDVDGVMYQWDKTARYMLRTEFGYSKDGPLGQPGDAWNSLQGLVTKDQWQWLWGTGVKQGLFRYGHLYSGTIEAIRTLNTLGDVVVITHRPRSAVQDTLDWLSYLRLPFQEVHMLTSGELKSRVTPHCQLYVDDKPENIIDFGKNTSGVPLLWRRPWNEPFIDAGWPGADYEESGMWVDSWEEVIVYARQLHR